MSFAEHRLHSSGRAALPHPAPTLGDSAQAHEGIRVADASGRKPCNDQRPHPARGQVVALTAMAYAGISSIATCSELRSWARCTTFGGKGGGIDPRARRRENAAKQLPSVFQTQAGPLAEHRSAPSGPSARELP
jgi:hypothetical protein